MPDDPNGSSHQTKRRRRFAHAVIAVTLIAVWLDRRDGIASVTDLGCRDAGRPVPIATDAMVRDMLSRD
ncbi:hypothetical protein [Methylobacterium trifolii]|uniref:Transposase n=1 Tax=Methylobacterium trifolii TaxID=1003092 RepID=A0ABQ4TX25_9HYPH|nr:hypothetical protein [Methylobacterium trifolii]GJE59815.1 hypothetical protein MPOCJGCO_1917 [Methylobacterium trifolii]